MKLLMKRTLLLFTLICHLVLHNFTFWKILYFFKRNIIFYIIIFCFYSAKSRNLSNKLVRTFQKLSAFL